MTFYDCMTCSNNKFSSMPPCLFLLFPAIELALYPIFIWIRRVGIWCQRLEIGVGKALLRRYCWVMKSVYQSRDHGQELKRFASVQVIAKKLDKVLYVACKIPRVP